MAKLFIISGPSGVGKDTIVDGLLERHPRWSRLLTSTTRPQMAGEKERKYHYLTEEEFKELISRGEIFESANVHNYYYGVTRENITKALRGDNILVFDLDIQGAQHYQRELGDQVYLIFLKPDSLEALEKRIRERKRGEDEKEIAKRLEDAKKEMKAEEKFNRSIINSEGQPEKAVDEIEKIILKEIEN